jgi:hypothetical protein
MDCPVPDSATEVEDPDDELLLIVTLPLTDPVTVGLNVTFMVALWPGFKVSGVVIPETEKPVPETETPLTVTAEVPVELRVTD